ncbi:MAG: HlyD family efflux transporter periplasmic adaptor subunit [Flavobacterium sp.]|nr:MAG: HlyD family efflux transporter periplasmic adaptor subunit [Flavobacterium sp.]
MTNNNSLIKEGDVIALIESTAKHDEVLTLSNQLDTAITLMRKGHDSNVARIFNQNFQNLGEMQPLYESFSMKLQVFVDYKNNNFFKNKIRALNSDVAYQDSLRRTLLRRQELLLKDFKLAEEKFQIHKQLLDRGVISKAEFRSQNSEYLSKQSIIPEMDASLLSNSNYQREKAEEIATLRHEESQQSLIFYQVLQSLKSAVDEWKKAYVIVSPISGITYINGKIQENQYLKEGSIIGYINPKEGVEYIELNLSQTNLGKVVIGLDVQLRIDAFPYQEYGFLEGNINYVSNIATDSGFIATVKLKNGLKTSNNVALPYKVGLSGQAIVITKNMRLLERIYYKTVKTSSVSK